MHHHHHFIIFFLSNLFFSSLLPFFRSPFPLAPGCLFVQGGEQRKMPIAISGEKHRSRALWVYHLLHRLFVKAHEGQKEKEFIIRSG